LLLNDLKFEKAFILLNARSKLSYPDCSINSEGIPTCPYDNTLPMKHEGIAKRKTQNEKTLHADLLLAGITQLLTVVLADKINKHQYIRSVKPLIA